MAGKVDEARLLAALDARARGESRAAIARAHGFRTVPNLDRAVRKVIEADTAHEPEARAYWRKLWPETTPTSD